MAKLIALLVVAAMLFLWVLTVVSTQAAAQTVGPNTIGLRWDPVEGAEFYRIYYGPLIFNDPVPENGQTGVRFVDTPATQYTLTDLDANTSYWICAKAGKHRADGSVLLSEQCSNFIDGWPRPRITQILTGPVVGGSAPGTYAFDVTIAGANFRPDPASQEVVINMPGVTIQNVTREPNRLTMRIEWLATVPPGPVDLLIVNHDGSECNFSPQTVNGKPPFSGCVTTTIQDAFTIVVDVRPGRVLRLDWIVP